MKEIKKQIEELTEQAEALAEVREDVLVMNQEITAKVMVALFEKLSEAIDELMEGIAKKETAKDFGDVLKAALSTTLSETVTQIFSSYKPGDFKPTINVDLKPIQQTFADISKQNDAIASLLNKLLAGDGGKSDELHKLITAMIGRQNVFLEKGMKQFDYTKELKAISDNLNKNDRIERLDVKRDRADNLITSVIPIYKEAPKTK